MEHILIPSMPQQIQSAITNLQSPLSENAEDNYSKIKIQIKIY